MFRISALLHALCIHFYAHLTARNRAQAYNSQATSANANDQHNVTLEAALVADRVSLVSIAAPLGFAEVS